ncbi:MAG: hypothetical protein R3E08_01985 [Thiotrichaceae bacterium]
MNIDFTEASHCLKFRTTPKEYNDHWMSMKFLNVSHPTTKLMRKILIEWGYTMQQWGYRLTSAAP